MANVSLMPLLRRCRRFITARRRYSARVAPLRATRVAAILVGATVSAVGLASVGAHAATPPADASPLLWATVNVCDTADHPDTVGVRGSMPGSGHRDEEMFMRFQLQYFRAADNRWHNIGPSGDSGFIDVGSSRFRARQAGRDFTVTPPRNGAFQLRGAVTFEWRRAGEVTRRARKRTRSGHPNTQGADPADFSAAICQVKQ
jgi:hypothetical protein